MKSLEIVLGCLGMVLLVVFVLTLHLAFIAGAIYGGYKAYVAFQEGHLYGAFWWTVICVFCTLGLLSGIARNGRSE